MDGVQKRRNKTSRNVEPKNTMENITKSKNTMENTTEPQNTTENTTEPENAAVAEDTIESEVTTETEDATDSATEPEDVTESATESEKGIIPQAPVKNFKYYFNRFRYYHYVIAEKVDTAIGVLCLMILKVYFFLTGHEQLALESDGSVNAMNMGVLDDDY
ncbi:uncharacterized protein LOC143216396 [Lasioglossum baleicum]|uniref:uncharacterized protein LOC143216396 n=1 Tax=Lasioglossum baleicum TaxID=434251 RepID=UPI003FCC5615